MIYSPNLVERLLSSYLDIRYTLEGKGSQLPDKHQSTVVQIVSDREVPLGGKRGGPWPFMEPRRAKTHTDGKGRARSMEELHCAVIDIEDGMQRISRDDFDLIMQYYILGTHTLEELAKERNLHSRGSMQRRLQRAVARLAQRMEAGE